MILFVTEQYAGAEYLLPLLKRWSETAPRPWGLVAVGASVALWRNRGFAPLVPEGDPLRWLREKWCVLRPDAVLASASAGGRLEKAAIVLAREKRKPSAQFLDMWTGYEARFGKNSKMDLLPDNILAIDDRCMDEARGDGLDKVNFHLAGQPYFEELIARRPLPGERILLAGQPVAKYWERRFGYDETDFWRVAGRCLGGRPEVLATYHPEEAKGGQQAFAMEPGRGSADVADSHTVLGMYSTQLIVGHLWGRKVASLQPGLLGADPCPLSRWGVIPRLESEFEVNDFLTQPSDPETGAGLCREMAGSLDRLETFCLNLG